MQRVDKEQGMKEIETNAEMRDVRKTMRAALECIHGKGNEDASK